MPFLEILLALLLGISTGVFTGIAPGIHVNLVSLLVLSASPILLQYTSPVVLGVYIISLAIAHSFLDTLPSIYLGAPDAGQALNVLPGHRLLLRGEGHSAVIYTLIGSFGSLLMGTLLFPLFIVGMIFLAPYIQGIMGYLLIAIMIYMIAREKQWLKSLACFLLAGCLGLLVFSIPALHQPLFPLLSGLFGFSLLIVSLSENSKIPVQKTNQPLHLSTKVMVKSVSAASMMGFVAAFLPGFGSSQAAILGQQAVGEIGDEGFLTLVGGINTANMLISIATAYALNKSRNGAILVVNKLVESITLEMMILFIVVALIAGALATILTLQLSKIFAKWIVKVNYQKLIIGIISFITLLVIYFDGFIGLAILLTATAIGLMAASWKVGKSHLMGCLVVPVILYFVL